MSEENFNFEQEFGFGDRDFGDDVSGEIVHGEEGPVDDGFEREEQKFEATFGEMQQKQVFGEQLDARSQKDKPFILLRDELLRMGQEPKFIDDTIKQLRPSQVFPTLNAVYVANAKLFYANANTTSSADIKRWVTEMNKRFGKEYLDEVNFFRYLVIGKKLFEIK